MFLGKYLKKWKANRRLEIILEAMKPVYKTPLECLRLLGEILGDNE